MIQMTTLDQSKNFQDGLIRLALSSLNIAKLLINDNIAQGGRKVSGTNMFMKSSFLLPLFMPHRGTYRQRRAQQRCSVT